MKRRREIGLFHCLPEKFQDSLISICKMFAKDSHVNYLEWIRKQLKYKKNYKSKKKKAKCDSCRASIIMNCGWHSKNHLARCWRTKKQALEEFNYLLNKTQKLKYVKEQILICYLGFDGRRHITHGQKGTTLIVPMSFCRIFWMWWFLWAKPSKRWMTHQSI